MNRNVIKVIFLFLATVLVFSGCTKKVVDTERPEDANRFTLEKYLEILPFDVNDLDKNQMEKPFSNMIKAKFRSKNEDVAKYAKEVESIVKPYWFNNELKEKYIDKSLLSDDILFFLNVQDKEKLLVLIDKLDNTSTPESLETYFKNIGLYYKTYFQAMGNATSIYKKEIEESKIQLAEMSSNDTIKKFNKLTDKRLFDLKTFLYSRPFVISDKDINTIYFLYEDLDSGNNKKTISEIHASLNRYWYEEEILTNLLPYDSYKEKIITHLGEDQQSELEKLYGKIIENQKNKNAVAVINSISEFYNYLGESVEKYYIDIPKSYNLVNILNKEAVNE